jgi:hypothetical protein
VDEFGPANVMLGQPANERTMLDFMPFDFAGPSNSH